MGIREKQRVHAHRVCDLDLLGIESNSCAANNPKSLSGSAGHRCADAVAGAWLDGRLEDLRQDIERVSENLRAQGLSVSTDKIRESIEFVDFNALVKTLRTRYYSKEEHDWDMSVGSGRTQYSVYRRKVR